MRLSKVLVSTLIGTGLPLLAPPALADNPAPAGLGANAALDYWQAIYFAPKLDEQREKALDESRTTTPDQTAEKAVQDGYRSITFVRLGAEKPACNWGLPLEQQGITTLMPQLSAARTLARLMLAESQLEIRDGKGAAADDDWVSTITLGRNIASDNLVIGLLVDHGIETMAIDVAAADLPHLDHAALDHLAAALKKLPPRQPLGTAVRAEQLVGQRWLIVHLKQDHDPQWRAHLAQIFGGEEPINTSAKILAGFDSPESLAAKLQDLDPLYDRLEQAADMPYDQFEKIWPALEKQINSTPAAQLVMVAHFDRVRRSAAAAETRLALLTAAIDVARAGPESLKSHADPFGSGPFTYRGADKNFELSSTLTTRDGQPVTLKVGSPQAR